ncbi:MAG: hypothetical protein LBD41_02690 [Clostridiales Family XIII bacterium]|nr:hypothetical protein [Clostridiales Family XIII bacterium]
MKENFFPENTEAVQKILRFCAENEQKKSNSPEPQIISRYVRFKKNGNNTYATLRLRWLLENGQERSEDIDLGRVIDEKIGLYKNKVRGYFVYDHENGFREADPAIIPRHYKRPFSKVLHFGDVWAIDQILKRTGLAQVIDELIPPFNDSRFEDYNYGDTLKALVAFRVLESVDLTYAEDWFNHSFARILYPEARLEINQLSLFHAILGYEDTFHDFFSQYRNVIIPNKYINKLITNPIIIDVSKSTYDIKEYISTVKRFEGELGADIRLFYAYDKNTKLPLSLESIAYTTGEYHQTLNQAELLSYADVKVETYVLKRIYGSLDHLEILLIVNRDFITSLSVDYKEFRDLIIKHDKDEKKDFDYLLHDGKIFHGYKVPYTLYDREVYAYILTDLEKEAMDKSRLIIKYREIPDILKIVEQESIFFGKSIILSSKNHEIREAASLYLTALSIDNIFDIRKHFTGISPLIGTVENTIRGCLLVAFISTVVSALLKYDLKDSDYSLDKAIYKLHNLMIKIYHENALVEKLDKSHREIFKLLHIKNPFTEQNTVDLTKSVLVDNFNPKNEHKAQVELDLENSKESLVEPPAVKKLGRPKGSKNKPKSPS